MRTHRHGMQSFIDFMQTYLQDHPKRCPACGNVARARPEWRIVVQVVVQAQSATQQQIDYRTRLLVMIVIDLFKKPTYLVEFHSSPYLVFEPVELDEPLIR